MTATTPLPPASPGAAPAPSATSSPGTPASFYDAVNYKPDDSVGYLMRRVLSLFVQAVERELGPTGLTHAQWVPLLKLHRGQASTVAELARECDHDAGATTRLLDRLESKGLCQRVRSQTDRRVVNIELTDAGTEAARQIPAILSKVQNEHLAGFTFEEWESLKASLQRILDTAQRLQAQAHDTTTP